MINLIADIVFGFFFGFIPSRSKSGLMAAIIISVVVLTVTVVALVNGTSH
jgi:hypothetical protein